MSLVAATTSVIRRRTCHVPRVQRLASAIGFDGGQQTEFRYEPVVLRGHRG